MQKQKRKKGGFSNGALIEKEDKSNLYKPQATSEYGERETVWFGDAERMYESLNGEKPRKRPT